MLQSTTQRKFYLPKMCGVSGVIFKGNVICFQSLHDSTILNILEYLTLRDFAARLWRCSHDAAANTVGLLNVAIIICAE